MAYIYPTSYVMKQIEPELVAADRANRLGMQILPIVKQMAWQVRWTQEDGSFGLMSLRGLDGAPIRAELPNAKLYAYEPGVFGNFLTVGETELTQRAGGIVIDNDNIPIDVSDLILSRKRKLIQIEDDRIESSIWSVLQGSLTITNDGNFGTQVTYQDTYAIQTYTAAITWATVATATPILNFQSVQQLGVGRSVDLGGGAVAYMNSVTFNRLLNNTNASDFGGRRINAGSTVNNLGDINAYLVAQNSPQIKVYDGGYNPVKTTSNAAQVAAFQKFIPDGRVIVVGRRTTGESIGNYVITRNANTPGMRPDSYDYVKDYAQGINAPKETPPRIEVHRGHNGGPYISIPSAIVLMNV